MFKLFIGDSWNKLGTCRFCPSESILFRVEQGIPLKNHGTMEQVVEVLDSTGKFLFHDVEQTWNISKGAWNTFLEH